MSNKPYLQDSYFDNMPQEISLKRWQNTVNVISEIFHVPGAWIMQANIKGVEVLVASESIQDDFPAGIAFDFNVNVYCKTVIQNKKTLYVKNAEKEGIWNNNPEYTDAGFKSYLGVPLQWPNGDMFGTLCALDTNETNYPASFISLLCQLKELIDGDLRNLLLIKKLKKQSVTDELSEINNRFGFIENARQLISLAKRSRMSLSLMYFDINGLKMMNDSYGHQMGDFIIKSFAEALSKSIRKEDIIARLGGDEFCFLGVHQFDDKGETVRLRVTQLFAELTKSDERIKGVSFSVGCKSYDPVNGFDLDKMLSETDCLMYANKKSMKEAQKLKKSD
jgi:diguanylate cyclase (GGDEF)-like protein